MKLKDTGLLPEEKLVENDPQDHSDWKKQRRYGYNIARREIGEIDVSHLALSVDNLKNIIDLVIPTDNLIITKPSHRERLIRNLASAIHAAQPLVKGKNDEKNNR